MSSPLLSVHVFVAWRGPTYVALCLELGVAASGETAEAAIAQLEQAVAAFVESRTALGIDISEEYEPLSEDALAEYRREVEAGARLLEYQLLPPEPRWSPVG
ncbi:MAG TPA: hypothetical protein VF234_06330 [Limnochordia bacterium]